MTTTAVPAPNALARAERTALCDLLLEVGPDAPTLCGGWTTRDLAAHLVIREGRPDAAMGLVVGPLAGWTERVQAGAATRDFGSLVESVRTGPPRWSLMSLTSIDAQTNTIEFFVHHEDVRRATEPWTPRDLDDATAADLWARLDKSAKYFARRSPVGVVIVATDGPSAGVERRVKSGDSSVTLRGPVGEIVLALYGRVTSGLAFEGTESDIAAFHAYPR